MCKLINKLKIALILILFLALQADAELRDNGGGLIYDSDYDITWLQDANYANTSGYKGTNHANGKMNWQDAKDWAGSLSYQGAYTWRLPEMVDINSSPCTGLDCLETEALHIFNNKNKSSSLGLFKNLASLEDYWSQTESQANSDYVKSFSSNNEYNEELKSAKLYVWAVHDGDQKPKQDSSSDSEEDEGNIIGCFVSTIHK